MPILIVGSTRCGGTCKTDLVAWIARRHPRLAILAHPTGDEEHWLSRQFPRRVFVDGDFLRAWERARLAGFELAVCDGGLQDPALEDSPALWLEVDQAPVGLSDLLPSGRHRELLPRPRADLHPVVMERDLSARLDPSSLPAPGTKIVAACSVARPQAFFADLESHGLVLVERLAFGDHRVFGAKPVRSARARHPGIPWVVTEKDQARQGSAGHLPTFAARRILSPSRETAECIDRIVAAQSRKRTAVTPRG